LQLLLNSFRRRGIVRVIGKDKRDRIQPGGYNKQVAILIKTSA
jgi:hypothetical protein